MDPRPLSPAEQYGFTNGWCHVFARVAHGMLGGEPTVLVATDARQLKEHDWPADMPLALHVFLVLPDGSVVDAEGRRSLDALKRSFGVKRGYTHELVRDPTWERASEEFGHPERVPGVLAHLAGRLQALGWATGRIPDAQNLLAKHTAYRAAQEQWITTDLARYKSASTANPSPAKRPRRSPA